MHDIELKLGKKKVSFQMPSELILGTINLTKDGALPSEEAIVLDSLRNPIGTKPLQQLIQPNDRICIIISDVTRMYQRPHVFLPILIEDILKAGGKEENIFFLSALGSHRKHTKEEHLRLLGEDLYNRFPIEDHDCDDTNNLISIGTTSRGTVVEINKKAFEADRVIVTGALVYHVMSGWGGGRKSILPGIASRKSIMQNHGISISDTIGNGPNPSCDCALYEENPLNLDMVEAAELFSPDFMFNVILGDGRIIAAVSGDITQAHKKGCEMVSRFNDVPISEKADMIIASAGGYPKDINLYQSTKVIYNAMRALKDKGVMVVLAECNEGFGNPEVQHILQDYTSNLDREMELRNDYTISKYIGFLAAWYAEKYHIIYVSSINPDEVVSAGITVVSSVEEALKAAYQIKGTDQLATYIMPDGSAYPVLKS